MRNRAAQTPEMGRMGVEDPARFPAAALGVLSGSRRRKRAPGASASASSSVPPCAPAPARGRLLHEVGHVDGDRLRHQPAGVGLGQEQQAVHHLAQVVQLTVDAIERGDG